MKLGVLPVLGLIAVATLVLYVFTQLASKGERKFQEGRVVGVTGKKGHGKTIFGVHELLRHVNGRYPCRECSTLEGRRVNHDGHIATNGSINVPEHLASRVHHLTNWDDVKALPHGCLVMLDEVHLMGWAPAQAGQTLPADVQWILSQCRKLHLEIMWISQDLGNVSAGLRRQTDEIARCQKSYFRRMSISFFEIVGGVPQFNAKAAWKYAYRVTSKLAASYDTYELLAMVPAVGGVSREAGLPPAAPSTMHPFDVVL